MRKAMVALVLLFTSCAFADNSLPGFLLLRQSTKLVLVAPPEQSSFELTDAEPLFSWEGHSSRATFSSTAEGVTVEFKLDIIGPDWLFVTLAEDHRGLKLTVCRTDSSGTENRSLDARTYSDYSGILEDSTYSPMISALLRRSGQNPLVPDVACLRVTLFGVEPPSDMELERQCEELIELLDDTRWQTRNSAMRQLAQPDLMPHAFVVARRMNLTPEQHARMDDIAARYSIDVEESLVKPLASLALSQGEVALLSQSE
jgi:hypothetical protein